MVAPAPGPVSVDIAQFSIAPARLACGPRLGLVSDTRSEVRLRVDDALDRDLICGIEVADCTSVDVDVLEPPILPLQNVNPFVVLRAQCRRRAAFEVFVVEDERLNCDVETCECSSLIASHAVLTSTTGRPSWWPCGDGLPFCASALPLYRADPECEVMMDPDG